MTPILKISQITLSPRQLNGVKNSFIWGIVASAFWLDGKELFCGIFVGFTLTALSRVLPATDKG